MHTLFNATAVVTALGMLAYSIITWIGWLQLSCHSSSNHYTAYFILVVELAVIAFVVFILCMMLVSVGAAFGEMSEEEKNRYMYRLQGRKRKSISPEVQAKR